MTGMCTGLGAPVWPGVLSVTIKLVFPVVDGQRLERSFRADFASPVDAFNVACCMWSTEHTGYGAVAAVLIDEATGQQYPVTQIANTCGQYPPTAMARVAKTGTDTLVPVPSQTGAPAGDITRQPVPARGAALRGRGAPPFSGPRRDRRSEGIGDAPRPPAHTAESMFVPGEAR